MERSTDCSSPTLAKKPLSAQEWEDQRSTISELYVEQNYTLVELQNTMLLRFKFKATKRQYTKRIADWNLNKNLKAHEKDALLKEIANAHSQNLPVIGVSMRGRPVDLDILQRHSRSRRRSNSQKQRRRTKQCNTTVLGEALPNPLQEHTKKSIQLIYNKPLVYANTAPLENLLRLCCLCLRQRFESHQPLGSLESNDLEQTQTLSSSHSIFWSGIKNGIYLQSLGSSTTSWQVISTACHDLMAQLPDDIDTLREIFATLSPVRSNVNHQLRSHVLTYLAGVFSIKRGETHAIAMICRDLLRADCSNEALERALDFTANRMEQTLGESHAHVLRCRRAQITSLRRSGKLDAAERLSVSHIATTTRAYGRCDKYTRRAMSDLVHIYSEKKDYETARIICEDVIRRSQVAGGTCAKLDEAAIYAMEDLVELCVVQGNVDCCAGILHQARDAAFLLWGADAAPSVSISYKLRSWKN